MNAHGRPVRRTVLIAALVMTAAADAPRPARAQELDRVRAAQRRRVELIRRLEPTVISVFRIHARTGELARGSGSGVIISPDGYALTNYHVTGSAEELRVGMPGGHICKARRLGVDPTGDIAMIKIESHEPLACAELGSSDDLEVGQWVIAMGNPFLLATDFRPTVSLGVVSGLHRYLPGGGLFRNQLIYPDAIQVDAALNPGNSGGPLFDMRGRLVGINGRIAPRRVRGMRMQKLNAGMGFAVSIDRIKPLLEDLKAGERVDRGYLGVTKVKPLDGGARIEKIAKDSPAELFDLRAGDLLLSAGGAEVTGLGELKAQALSHRAGEWIDVRLRRGDDEITRRVQLAGLQSATWLRVVALGASGSYAKSILRKDADEPDKSDRGTDDAEPSENDEDSPDSDQDPPPEDGQP